MALLIPFDSVIIRGLSTASLTSSWSEQCFTGRDCCLKIVYIAYGLQESIVVFWSKLLQGCSVLSSALAGTQLQSCSDLRVEK